MGNFNDDLAESIAVLRDNAPPSGAPYYGLFSGGKDSVALKHVARMAGVPVVWHYNVTTIDPPELVRFIKRQHADVEWVRSPRGNFFRRAAEVKGFPTRRCRWCCAEYKEQMVLTGSHLLMGIRAQESSARAARWALVQPHWRTSELVVNPLLRWEAEDLWDFIRGESLPYCGLYDDGFHRLGCVGCPNARKGRYVHFARWPKYERRWRYVFRRTWERRSGTVQRDGKPWFGDRYFVCWEQMWDWWLSDARLPDRPDPHQLLLPGAAVAAGAKGA